MLSFDTYFYVEIYIKTSWNKFFSELLYKILTVYILIDPESYLFNFDISCTQKKTFCNSPSKICVNYCYCKFCVKSLHLIWIIFRVESNTNFLSVEINKFCSNTFFKSLQVFNRITIVYIKDNHNLWLKMV